MEIQLLLSTDIDLIANYEKALMPSHLSPIEVEMNSWETSWRKESLEHYVNIGWSFVAKDNNKIVGYVLAQPLLFFNKWTQSLWVEDLTYDNDDIGYDLIDVVVKWAKSKHLQKVLMNKSSKNILKIQEKLSGFTEGGYSHFSTTKMGED